MKRPCPLCQNDEVTLLGEQRYILEPESPLPEMTGIVSCTKCGFNYARSDKNAEDYKKYYAAQTRYESSVDASGSGEYLLDRERISELVDLLTGSLDQQAKILDIGAARGGVLKELKRRGYKNLYAMDPSNVCVQSIAALGMNAGKANLEDDHWPFDPEKFDLIILSHVLEHVFDIAACMENAKQRLATNGIIYVEVPDAARYSTSGFPAYYFFDPEHINHFDLAAFETLALRQSLQVERTVIRELDVGANEPYPSVGAFLANSALNTTTANSTAPNSEKLLHYMNASRDLLASAKHYSALTELAEQNSPVVVWGAGSYCRRLLANTPLAETRLLGIIDSDIGKQGRKLAGTQIFAPEQGLAIAKQHKATLVIAIAVNSRALVKQIEQSTENLNILSL